jgi:hypothetical protein
MDLSCGALGWLIQRISTAKHVLSLMQRRRKGPGTNVRVVAGGEQMQRFVPIEDLCKGRHFDRPTGHRLVCELVHELQTELAEIW